MTESSCRTERKLRSRFLPSQSFSFSAASLPAALLALTIAALGACSDRRPAAPSSGPGDTSSPAGSPGSNPVLPNNDALQTSVAGRVVTNPLVYRWQLDRPTPYAWSVQSSQPWLNVQGASSGTFTSTGFELITLTVDPIAAGTLPLGDHVAAIRFLDVTNARTVATRQFTLSLRNDEPLQGFRDFTPSPDSRIVYVSSSQGDDANDGLTPQRPKRTIAAGRRLMRDQFPDWLLLRRGDVFQEAVSWTTRGRSAKEPQLLSSYGPGTARPRLNCAGTTGYAVMGGGSAPATRDNIAMSGIHFNGREGSTGTNEPTGLMLLSPSANVWIEDCVFENFLNGAVVQGYEGRHTNITIRRTIFADNYTVGPSHAQGMFVANVDRMLLEDCTFDMNGWNANVPGAVATIFRHNVYIANGNTGVVVRGSMFVNGASHGLQLRCGGVLTDNLFLRNSISMTLGGGTHPEPGGVGIVALRNIVLDGKDIAPEHPRGWGISASNLTSGVIAENVVANNVLGNMPVPFTVDIDDPTLRPIRNLAIVGNVISNWGGTFAFSGAPQGFQNVQFARNEFFNTISNSLLIRHAEGLSSVLSGGNVFHSSASGGRWFNVGSRTLTLPQWQAAIGDLTSTSQNLRRPFRGVSVADYQNSMSRTPTHEAFMAEVRQQGRANWRHEYTAYAVRDYVRTSLGM